MDQRKVNNAAARARWLAEVGEALAEARKLANELSRTPSLASEGQAAAQSIASAIRLLDGLRRGRPAAIAEILGPKWLELPRERQ
jgi:hypothetical protein